MPRRENFLRMKLAAFIRDAEVGELLHGAAVAFSLKVLGVFAAFGFYILLCRNLGAGEAGLFFLAVSLVEVLAMACRLGLDQSAIALIGKHAGQQEWPQVKGIFQASSRVVVLASLPAAAGLALAAPFLASAVFKDSRLVDPLRIAAAAILPLALYNLFGESLKGLRRMAESQFVTTCAHQALLLLGILLLARRLDIPGVSWLYGGAAALAASLGYALWRRATPQLAAVQGTFSRSALRAVSLPLFWVNLLSLINAKVGIFSLGHYGTTADVAVLNAALRITLLTNIAILAVNAISAPKFAALHGSGDRPGLVRVCGSATALLVAACLPLLLAMLCLPDSLMGLFGRDFAGHGSILVILALGQGVNIAAGPMGVLLSMAGRERCLRNIFYATTPVHLLAQVLLTPAFGTAGAAWAITSNIVLVNLAAAYAVRKQFGFIALFATSRLFAKAP